MTRVKAQMLKFKQAVKLPACFCEQICLRPDYPEIDVSPTSVAALWRLDETEIERIMATGSILSKTFQLMDSATIDKGSMSADNLSLPPVLIIIEADLADCCELAEEQH